MRLTDRAQTPLDFAIAMGIFLLTIAFVFSFVPSLTTPFVDGNQDQSPAADRVASHLTQGALADPNDPFVVQEACASVFFNESTNHTQIPAGCGYNGSTLGERVGISDRLRVNVTVLHVNTSESGDDRFRTVCAAENGTVYHEETIDCGHADIESVYRVGDRPPDDGTVTVARRIVAIPGCEFGTEACDATVRVAVW
jgi:hypothetical protein